MLGQISVCLAALYLRGIPRAVNPNRRRWSRVVSCLRSADCDLATFPDALQASGLSEEALIVSGRETLDGVSELFARGGILTAVDPLYPARWLERLGEGAPPALWKRGEMPDRPLIGIVGSRRIDEKTRAFAEEIGRQTALLGYAAVSGGATGCDLAGVKGAILSGGGAVELLPYGLDQYFGESKCGLSVCPPSDVFSTSNAMERNALIYAASEQTVVVHARFKQGGTWLGAVHAVRRKLCPLIVRQDGSEASRSLIALGGTPLEHAANLNEALSIQPTQRGLFGIG